MRKLIRLFDDHLEHLFVRKSEDGCQRYNRFHDELPDSLRYRNRLFPDFPEQSSNGFIVVKSLLLYRDDVYITILITVVEEVVFCHLDKVLDDLVEDGVLNSHY